MCIEFVMRVSVFFDGLCLLQWLSVCRGHQSYGGLCRTGASGFLSPNLPPPALTPRPLKPSCSHTPRRTYSSPASDSQWRRHPSTWGRSDWLTNRQLAGVWALAIWKRKQSELKVFCSLIGQLTGTYQNAAGTVLFFIFLSAFIGLFVFYLNILVLKHVRWTFFGLIFSRSHLYFLTSHRLSVWRVHTRVSWCAFNQTNKDERASPSHVKHPAFV